MRVISYKSVKETGTDTAYMQVDFDGERFGLWLGPGFEPGQVAWVTWGGMVSISDDQESAWWDVLEQRAIADTIRLPEAELSRDNPDWYSQPSVEAAVARLMGIHRYLPCRSLTELLEEVGMVGSL